MDRVPGERRRTAARALLRAVPALGAIAGVVLAGALVLRQAALGDLFRIREIRFEGLARVTPDELLELSPVQRGDSLLLCDTDLLAAALRRHPWVAAVDVERRLPRTLLVRVVERKPAALVELGGLYLVDAKGVVFKRAVPGDGLDLPVITGIAREAWIERREEVEPLLSAALALLARWTERGLDRTEPVSEIHIDPDYGTTLWAGDDGLEVRLGQGDLPEKLERLERVLAAVAADRERPLVLHLDNRRRPDWVTVRLAGRRGETGGRLAMTAGRGAPPLRAFGQDGGPARGRADAPSPAPAR